MRSFTFLQICRYLCLPTSSAGLRSLGEDCHVCSQKHMQPPAASLPLTAWATWLQRVFRTKGQLTHENWLKRLMWWAESVRLPKSTQNFQRWSMFLDTFSTSSLWPNVDICHWLDDRKWRANAICSRTGVFWDQSWPEVRFHITFSLYLTVSELWHWK